MSPRIYLLCLLGLFQSVKILLSFLVFQALTILKSAGQVLSRISFRLGLSDVFSWLDWACAFGDEYHRGDGSSLVHQVRGSVMSICLTTGDTNPDPRLGGGQPRFSTVNLVFPFVMNKYVVWERSFETVKMMCFFLKLCSLFLASIGGSWLNFLLCGSNGDFLFSSFFLHLLIEISLEESYFSSLTYLFMQLFFFSSVWTEGSFILFFGLCFITLFCCSDCFIFSTGRSSALPPPVVRFHPFCLSMFLLSGTVAMESTSSPQAPISIIAN